MRAGLIALAAAYTAYALPQDPVAAIPADPNEGLLALEALGNSTFEDVKGDLAQAAAKAKRDGILGGTCTLSKLQIRREWGSLSSSQKTAYINAVKCLQGKPGKTPASLVPGVKNRFDDFVATHINQTMEIHWTGNFLSWHRYYTWLYEKALQDECGYTGTQPYWNWGISAITGLENSPVFDGSATSLSGNGVAQPGTPDLVLGVSVGLPPIVLPPGTGGGCVTSGPFQNMSVNLGPVGLELPGGGTASNPAGPFAYNPRCLKRSLTNYINQRYANVSSILTNILLPQNINDFQTRMQGLGGVEIGIHGGGHFSMGGDPGRDFFTSPGDPAFYMHHAMIDRVWWIWQSLNPSQRAAGSSAIAGTRTFLNMPPSADATIEDYINAGYAGGSPIKIKDALDTTKGPFCYVYL